MSPLQSSNDSGAAAEIQLGDTIFGRTCGYYIQEFIGEGSFGKVARCRNVKTGETVAVKIVKDNTDKYLHKEVSMLELIGALDPDKTNLVKFFEQFQHRGQTCLVFEMLDMSLFDTICKAREPWALNAIRPVAKQLLVALDALESGHILHADLKPDNIMLVNVEEQPFRVKLIDFGLSTTTAEVWPGMIIQPLGYRYGDHYEWNKAVTCIHNVLSQQRWLEHYGEIVIKNKVSDVCTCKITFVKSHYWTSDGKNEVKGVVLNRDGEVVHRFGGFWHEGIFCDTLDTPKCIWKPNVQPDDCFDYYGFSRYARELNELTPDLKAVLPPTDTRFRPDQRLLEEGKVSEADKKKDEVEEKQRGRRKEMAKRGEEHVPRFFRKALDEDGTEVWLYNETYWKLRKDPGFGNMTNLGLW